MTEEHEFTRMVYLGHRLGAKTRAGLELNRARAKVFLYRLQTLYPHVQIIAPWLTEVEIYDDHDPEARRAGLERCKYTISRCDELWLAREFQEDISSGMMEEAEFCLETGIPVRLYTRVPSVEVPGAYGWQIEEIGHLATLRFPYVRGETRD